MNLIYSTLIKMATSIKQKEFGKKVRAILNKYGFHVPEWTRTRYLNEEQIVLPVEPIGYSYFLNPCNGPEWNSKFKDLLSELKFLTGVIDIDTTSSFLKGVSIHIFLN